MGAKEGEKVSVYTLNGQEVLKTVITSSRQNFTVGKGMYLVKVGNSNYKIVVQ